ncbi:MAG: pilus assembly protein [Planctomycetes bacterium]|nr:pilus assembly protein [Planctomycetota bacterium]
MVEFAILLPVYLILLLGILYLGRIGDFRERSLEANRLATLLPGDQSEGAYGVGGGGPISSKVFMPNPGKLKLVEKRSDFPDPMELANIFYPTAVVVPPPPPPSPVGATGHADIDLDALLDDIEAVIDVGSNSPSPVVPPPPPAPDPRLVPLLQAALQGWVQRSTSHSEYRYNPGYLSLNYLKFDPVTPVGDHQTMSRTENIREVRDSDGASLSPDLLNQFQDGRAPLPGFPRFGNLPPWVMRPN